MTTKKNQVEKFKKVARELCVDEYEYAFDDKLKLMAKPKADLKAKERSHGKR